MSVMSKHREKMEGEAEVKSSSGSSSWSTTWEPSDWKQTQEVLKQRLMREDDFEWKIRRDEEEGECLKYVGGVDISYSKEKECVACATLVVLDLHTLQVVYCDCSLVTLTVPYFPGFLAFREAPVYLRLLAKMRDEGNPLYPQLLMVDGNGLLHPRGFGSACQLGVMADIPTIGVGKNLHHVDGLTQSGVRQLLEAKAKEKEGEAFIKLTGTSGSTWGAAMRSTEGTLKPIFISVGHRISLDTAIRVVKLTCKYRVPEPIRQADIRSREYLRKHQMEVLKEGNL